jgi:hypothetical protein
MLWALICFIAISLSVEFLANCYLVVHINGIYMYASSVQVIQKSNVLAAMNASQPSSLKLPATDALTFFFIISSKSDELDATSQ